MDIIISAKHVEIEDEIKEKATALANRFAADYPTLKISSVRILFSTERNWQIVEILINAKNLSLHAAAKLDAMAASLTSAFEKLNTQMSRYLEKLRDLSVKADPKMKDKIWKSSELREAEDDADLGDYDYEIEEDK